MTVKQKKPRIRFEFRCSEEEKLVLEEKAVAAGYASNTSEYIKRSALNKRIDHRADVEHIVALNQLACRLKDIHAAIIDRPDNPIPVVELRTVLDEIVRALRQF